MTAATSHHRALADERRVRLVEELRREDGALDAAELARRLGLHPNTVRWHLGILAEAGIVSSRPAARTTRGRPRILYALTPEPVPPRTDEHRLLATIFAGALSQVDGATGQAEAAGRAWGRHLMPREPLTRTSDEEAMAEVSGLLDEQGFEPEVQGPEICMRRCPFHALAESHPEVVCAVHKGLISGALSALGSELEVESLDIFVQPDLCIARLAPREP